MLCYSCPRSKFNLRIYYYPIFSELIIARLRIIVSIRLEQVDIDGRRTIEADIVDLLSSSNEQTVTLYPNPTADMLYLDYEAETRQKTVIKILDLNGRTIINIVSFSNTGLNKASIDIKDLIAGQYVIQLYANDALIFADKVRKDK
jgi:hypothetical protein